MIVKENINFKRGNSPKKSLSLGGWIPDESFLKIKKVRHWEKWNKEISDTLIGKKIRFKGLMKNPDTTAHHTFLQVDKVITVGDTRTREFWGEFQLQDADTGEWYTISPRERIEFL
ncbi:MAG: hypothetical protein HC831_11795 [Chloroflexia bacterium]|nr:hypothetical protein [Chloroflexia bacterium]